MWICEKCNEEIEDNFDVCWNCPQGDEYEEETERVSIDQEQEYLNEKGIESNESNKKAKKDTKSHYIKAIVAGLIYSYYQTFYVQYGSHVDGMIDAYNSVYEDIGYNSRLVSVGMDEKIGYFFIIFLCVLIVPLILSLPVWLINKRKNFSGIFTTISIILIVGLFVFSYVALQNDEWYKISNPW